MHEKISTIVLSRDQKFLYVGAAHVNLQGVANFYQLEVTNFTI